MHRLLLLLDAKKSALSRWENPDTLKHGYCACFSKALLLYGYSMADAPQKVKPCSGSFIITQKWADCPSIPPVSILPFSDQDHRQRTTLTTYAILLPGSSQAGGPAPTFTEGAQTINNSFFMSQYIDSVNNLNQYLVFLAFSERRAYCALCRCRSSLTYSALK